MSRLERVLRSAGSDLQDRGYRGALVGGLAVSVRAEPRFTRDVDLALPVASDREAESLVRSLLAGGYRLLATVEQEAVGRLATARLLPPEETEEGVVVDLLFASSGIEPEVVATAERIEIRPGLESLVAGTGHLIALKLLARGDDRPQDQADLQALLGKAGPEDLRVAREAVELIVQRGFHRRKDLLAEIDEILAGR